MSNFNVKITTRLLENKVINQKRCQATFIYFKKRGHGQMDSGSGIFQKTNEEEQDQK